MKQIKIPDELYYYFEKVGLSKTYLKNDTIYMQGDNATSLYLIKKGTSKSILYFKRW